MAKVSPMQTSFSGGEFSALMKGQVELDRYRQALEISENYIPSLQGGLIRRSGTRYVAATKTNSKKARLLPFEFSTTQAYILEFGDQYIRFYRNGGQITSGGPAYEIATPYLEADLFQLRITQSADVLYITHPSYAPRTLSRTGHTAWTLSTIVFTDGPYLPINTTPYGLKPSAATGAGITISTDAPKAITGAANNGAGLIRITAVAHGFTTGQQIGIAAVTGTTEANGSWTITVIGVDTFDLVGSAFVNAYVAGGNAYPGLFVSTDVGRHIRLREGSIWGWVKIVTFINYGQVTADVVVKTDYAGVANTLTNTNAKTNFKMGVWANTTGWPACVTFHEDRLMFAGATNYPQRVDGSVTSEYTNMATSDYAGVVYANSAISFTLNANDVNVVRWLISDEKGLLAGSVGGEWIIRPSSQSEALTATNITAKRSTKYGSANVQALQVGKAALFVQGSSRKIRELTYFFDVDGFRAIDLTKLAEHVTQSGIVEMASQKEPQPLLWCVRTDGQLAGQTYERESDSLTAAWHRHILGGASDAAGTDAVVESAACIPSSDGTREDTWLLVKRYVNGAVVRHVEYLTKLFDDTVEQKDAFFVDCGLTYDAPLTISAITLASPAVVTSAAHGLSNGNKILASDILGLLDIIDEDDVDYTGTSPLNGQSFLVAGVTANTFTLTDLAGNAISTLAYQSPYVSGGYVRKYVSSLTGLTHLEGQTVDILADGAVQPSKIVTGGAIALSVSATTVHVGLKFKSRGKMLRLNAGSADGASIGKTQRTHRIGVMLHRSLGLKIGMDFDSLTAINFRKTSDSLSRAIPLFTGILSETIEADYDFENQLCFQQDQPLPSMVLALMPQMVTQDR